MDPMENAFDFNLGLEPSFFHEQQPVVDNPPLQNFEQQAAAGPWAPDPYTDDWFSQTAQHVNQLPFSVESGIQEPMPAAYEAWLYAGPQDPVAAPAQLPHSVESGIRQAMPAAFPPPFNAEPWHPVAAPAVAAPAQLPAKRGRGRPRKHPVRVPPTGPPRKGRPKGSRDTYQRLKKGEKVVLSRKEHKEVVEQRRTGVTPPQQGQSSSGSASLSPFVPSSSVFRGS